MAKIILHPPGTTKAEIDDMRLKRNLGKTPNERMKFMFEMITFAMKVKGGPLKKPQGKGVILKSKRNNEYS